MSKEKIALVKKTITRNDVGNSCLFPVYESDFNFIQKLKPNKMALYSIHKSRNPEHHKLIFALARCIKDLLPDEHFFKNQMPYDIIKAIMLDRGIVDYKLNLDGQIRIEPKSISFESMDENGFEPVSDVIFEAAAELLKVSVDELEKNYSVYL